MTEITLKELHWSFSKIVGSMCVDASDGKLKMKQYLWNRLDEHGKMLHALAKIEDMHTKTLEEFLEYSENNPPKDLDNLKKETITP